MRREKFLKWDLPAWLWGLIIAILTSYPKVELFETPFDATDKLAHFGVYFIFGLLLMRAFTKWEKLHIKRGFLRTTLVGVPFAVFDELHQLFIPGRTADLWDGAADILGIFTAQIVFYWTLSIYLKLKKTKSHRVIYDEYIPPK